MRGSTLAVAVDRHPARRQQPRPASSRASALPASTTGTRQRAAASRAALCSSTVAVAAVGAADQQHHVGPGRPQRRHAGTVERARRRRAPPGRPADSPTRCPASAVTSGS